MLGMPVYQIMTEMPQEELARWGQYFRRRPYGWREDTRAFLQLQAAGYKGQPESIFPSLKMMKDNIPQEVKSLPKGKFLEMMMSAKGGDDSGWSPPWISKND